MTSSVSESIDKLINALSTIVLGKKHAIKLSLACMLARGHLLIEDLPGMGKTTLAHSLAKVLGLEFKRIQFTSDLLPGDVLGISIFNSNELTFNFRPGPIFTQILLADEINRASPKTQSALLEAMSEYQVTVDGVTRLLELPFFVIGTQNSQHQTGTFPLPESQLDRFMMRISLGYPDPQSERQLLMGNNIKKHLESLTAILNPNTLVKLQNSIAKITANENLLDYAQRLLAYTRESGAFSHGLSPRAALDWLHCAKAWALIHHRTYVLPDDLQTLLVPIAAHRLMPGEMESTAKPTLDSMIKEVAVLS